MRNPDRTQLTFAIDTRSHRASREAHDMSGSDYIFATAIELLAALNERRVSSLEITQAAIEQIERLDPAQCDVRP